MTNAKSTKRALLTSMMAMLLCFTMLLGTTYAWFTDSATSGSNVITAGNLDIEVQYTRGDKDENGDYVWKNLDNATDLFQKGSWEPGHTEVVALKITNNGSLALKYTANMNIINETVGTNKNNEDIVLSDILTVTTVAHEANEIGDALLAMIFGGANAVDSTPVSFKNSNILQNDQVILPGAAAQYVIVTVDMAETVGNEANAKDKDSVPSIEFGINVVATQYTKEEDSFGPDYDAGAEYPEVTVVSNTTELAAALTEASDGATIVLARGTYEGLSFVNPSSYKAKNVSIIGTDDVVIDGFGVLSWTADSNIEIDGLTFKNVTFSGDLYLSTKVMANVTVENCDFINDARINQDNSAEKLTNLVVKNCTFTGDKNGDKTALMLDNTENVTVTGCTFTNIDYNVLQGGVSGTVLFDNNTINGTGNRVFRLYRVSNADITISNNTITSDGGENGELAKATDPADINLSNNTWNGQTDAEVANRLINIQ